MEEDTESQHKRQYDWLKQYQWQKGQSGNPEGGKKGKSAKTRAREWIEKMTDEQLADFLNQIDPNMVWRMAEGNPHNTEDVDFKGNLIIEISKEIAEKNDSDTITKIDSSRPTSFQSGESGEEIR
jgi:hypothetical protein